MNEFIKINDDLYYDETFDYSNYVCDKVKTQILGNVSDYEYTLTYSLIDCESPIEQLLSIELERLNLLDIHKFNPYIDVVGIEKQATIQCDKKKYRVDFLIPVWYKNQGGICFIVECDGHNFHEKTKEQVKKDNERIRDLQKNNYEIIRFSGSEIYNGAYKCANEIKNIIMSKCNYNKGE